MAKASFVSFHYQRDHWRVQQILRMGALDHQEELPAQRWEAVKQKGEAAVKAWIDEQMKYKQAVVVLIGKETSSRKYVKYEIERAWLIKKPLLGIYIHDLKDADQNQDERGENPFRQFGFSDSARTYADYVPVYNPADYTLTSRPSSLDIHNTIRHNVGEWAANGYRRP